MPRLKPWYNVDGLTPREDLRENRPVDASEFAVHLDHIRLGRESVSEDYKDPARFFDRTYLTKSLLELSAQVLRRLSGIRVETSAIFNMATQFGGGKTHALATLYHLAGNGDRAKTWKGVDRILSRAEIGQIPEADVAVFVGTEFDPIAGRGGNGEPVRKTPWGEIAWQLGGKESFAAVAEHDEQGVAPAGDVIRKMLPDGPALILMDELLNYVSRGRKQKLGDQLWNFVQNLSEEARASDRLALCVSIPGSELEMNQQDQRDYDSFKKLLDRLGKAIIMSAEEEIAEIIRRRLFDWEGLPQDGRKVASAYAEWAIDNGPALTGIDVDNAHGQFQACYPFHPSVLSVFERKWQSLPRFQRTRGVLRLLALWVAHNYQEDHRRNSDEPLITLGSAPLEDPQFRAALLEQLGEDKLEGPVTTDIVGKSDAHAIRLDKEASEAIGKGRLHQKVATTIFFESNGGQSQTKAEATLPEIKTAVGGPDRNLADVDSVVEGLTGTCFYLNWNRNRYRFGLTPNLNQVLVARRGNVAEQAIEERIKQETEKLFKDRPKEIDCRFFPARSNDVPNQPALTFVVFGLDMPAQRKETAKWMESIVRECGASGRTFKSALIFSVPDAAEDIPSAARDLLAWEDIDDDQETKDRLEESQKNLLGQNLRRAKRDFKESLWRAYRYLYLLGKDNTLQEVDLGRITSSSAEGSLAEFLLQELEKRDEITDGVGPNKLIKYWPSALTEWSTKAVRDAFYSSPLLPRLKNPQAIKRTICDGLSQGTIGYATKGAGGNLQLEHFEESLSEADVEISDDVFLLKREDALKLREPPRLTKLVVQPDHVALKPGEQASFRCSGEDQYGGPFEVSDVAWSATGGTITEEGLFTADEQKTGGLYTVHAECNGLQTAGEVRVKKPDSQTGGDDGNGGQGGSTKVQWQGEVPPQKWMNFYTKVLSRFATSQGLKLTVRFEVPADEQGESKADEARNGLRELGLDDDVEVT